MKKIVLFALVFLPTLFLYTTSTTGNDAQHELLTAISSASDAKHTPHIKQIHLFLHHVVNCLVGTRGTDFDANAGDPCIGSGRGAIKDYIGRFVDRAFLTLALEEAKHGLHTDNIQMAQRDANLSRQHLLKAESTL